jgi:hypothetical protein
MTPIQFTSFLRQKRKGLIYLDLAEGQQTGCFPKAGKSCHDDKLKIYLAILQPIV